MNKGKWKKFIENPWTVGIGLLLIGHVVSFLIDIVKKQRIFTTLIFLVSGAWRGFLYFLHIKVYMWTIIFLILLGIFALYIWYKIEQRINQQAEANNPDFLEYSKDKILGWSWEWSWAKNYKGAWYVANLIPVCEECGMQLVMTDDWNGYECLRCKKVYRNRMPDLDKVKIFIIDNVKRKYPHIRLLQEN